MFRLAQLIVAERRYVLVIILAIFKCSVFSGFIKKHRPSTASTRDFKMLRWQQQRERQNSNSARASRFFVHFSTVTARLRRENA